MPYIGERAEYGGVVDDQWVGVAVARMREHRNQHLITFGDAGDQLGEPGQRHSDVLEQ